MKKTTKRSLLLSALSLLLCMAMLVGSTFAWFTDSVTSGRNTIVSGNLDVELYYATWDNYNNEWTDYEKVGSNTKVFSETALYEPGYTEVVMFKVVNEGSLALKYSLDAKIYHETAGKNVYGDMFNLSNYLYTGTLAAADYNRAAAVAAATTQLSTGFNMKSTTVLNAGAEEELVLVLTMPTTVGNEANFKTADEGEDADQYQPKIDLGISLIATQATYEADDFDNLYDADATLPVNQAVTVPVGNGDTEIGFTAPDSKLSDFNALVPEGALADGVTELKLEVKERQDVLGSIQVSADQTATTYDIKIDGIAANNNEDILVTMNIGKNLTNVVLYHNDALIDSDYNAATGELSFATKGFSPFTVVCDSVDVTEVATEAELVAAIEKGGNIAFANDITITKQLNIVKDTVILGEGNTLFYTGKDIRVIDVATATNANLAVKDLTININNGYCQRGINYNVTNGKLVLNNVKFEGATKATYAVNLPGNSDGVVAEIVNCEIVGNIALNVWGADATVNVTNSYLSNYDNTEVEDYATISLNNDGSNAADGTVINVVGGTVVSYNEKGDLAIVLRNSTNTGAFKISAATTLIGREMDTMFLVKYVVNGEYAHEFYSCQTFQRALDQAAKNANAVVFLLNDVDLTEDVTVPEGADIAIDLNGFAINGTINGNWHVYN